VTKKAIVEEVLMDIYAAEGVLDPEFVVQVATEPSHPLHSYFEWDHRKAAHQYRVLQAYQMIRTVEVRIITADEDYKIRAFHPMRYVGREGGGYLHERDITTAEHPALLQTMHRDWTVLRRRYQHMREFWEMVGGDGAMVAWPDQRRSSAS
jgi:hypothetical protein